MPTPDQLFTYRKSVETFVTFTDEQWLIFSQHLYVRQIKKRQHFVTAGKTCNEVGLVVSGSFRFFVEKDGIEVTNYVCFGSDLVSSYKSFLRQEASLSSIEAMEDSVVICFDHATLQTLVEDERISCKMERFGRLVAEYLICCYEDRVLTFVSKTPEERYLELLHKQPYMLQRIPQYYLANFLGITPVSLSRTRKRIRSEKV